MKIKLSQDKWILVLQLLEKADLVLDDELFHETDVLERSRIVREQKLCGEIMNLLRARLRTNGTPTVRVRRRGPSLDDVLEELCYAPESTNVPHLVRSETIRQGIG